MKKLAKRSFILFLALAILLVSMPFGAFAAEKKPMQIATLSDTHYYPTEYCGNKAAAYQKYVGGDPKLLAESPALLESALAGIAEHAKANGIKYLLISGDLTKDGELVGHQTLAKRLEKFEKDTGIEVFVINGNHDINNPDACTFADDTFKSAPQTNPEQFKEIYKNLGYDHACSTFTPSDGKQAGGLSYSAELDGGYRLIAIDGGKYSPDSTKSGKASAEVGGAISPDLEKWVLDQIADAKSKGETVIGLTHFAFVPHFKYEPAILSDFVYDNYEELANKFADAGMHYVFTGHMHANDIAKTVSENGETLYDIETDSLISYPDKWREVLFDNTKGEDQVTTDVKSYDVDCVKQVNLNGKDVAKPFKDTYAFPTLYGTPTKFVENMISSKIPGLLSGVMAKGGIKGALKSFGIDIDSLLSTYVGDNGITVGSTTIPIKKSEVYAFVNDILSQLENKYIADPTRTVDALKAAADKILATPVSNIPDSNHGEDPTKPATLGDLAFLCLRYHYAGDEDMSKDPCLADALKNFKSGDTIKALINKLMNIAFDDLLTNEISKNIYINPDLLPEYSSLLNGFLGNDKSIYHVLQIVKTNFKFDPKEKVQEYINSYLTDSQIKSWGETVADVVNSFVSDDSPSEQGDSNASLPYSGKVATPAPSASNYILPSTVTVTFGSDPATSKNFSWYTSLNETGTDIEIIPYSENPVFTGTPTTGDNIKSSTTETVLKFPTLDFGIAALSRNKNMNRHTIEVSSLKPGTKYSYRIGDAQKGLWSEPGVIETADNSDSFTFIHVSDAQSQSEEQYKTFSNVIASAFKMYPNINFILETGDFVDNGNNENQWQWAANGISKNLMNSTVVPVSGNHEGKGDSALVKHFDVTGNVPKQDETKGLYYSFDYNNAHFMILNTEDVDKNGLSADQLAWLKKDASSSKKQWKIVAMHKSLYSNGSHYKDSDVQGLRKQLSAIMPQLGIDVVFSGHDHIYMRTNFINNNAVVEDKDTKEITVGNTTYKAALDPSGTMYVITGTAGVKHYPYHDTTETGKYFPNPAASVKNDDLPEFTSVTIKGDSLALNAYTVDSDGSTNKVDTFAISKAPKENNKPTPNPDNNNQKGNNNNQNSGSKAGKTAIPDTGDYSKVLLVIPPTALAVLLLSSKRKRYGNVK